MTKQVTVWNPDLGSFLLTAAVLQEILGGTEGGGLIDTAVVTVGAGTLSAAALIGGQITRSGPVAPFTDTLDTAAAIVAALQGSAFSLGETFTIRYKNTTIYPATLAVGAGVTLPASVVVPALSVGLYFGTVGGTSAAPTVAISHSSTVPLHQLSLLASTALTTNGAGAITAAAIAGGITLRSGTSAAFTDTSGTADAIIAAQPNLAIGQSFIWNYVNNSAFVGTLAGGVGVTLAEAIPANSWARYKATYTAASTVVMTRIAKGYLPTLGTTPAANGATPVAVSDAAATASSIITLTVNTPGGTAHGAFVASKTAGVGFSINSLAGDTSTYDYKIEG